MIETCTCIIPFYNEEKRVLSVLKKLIKIPLFDKFILVNDWSIDNSENVVKNFIKENSLKNISLISYKENKWKSNAVFEWLKQVDTEFVFLFDADLSNIKTEEITYLINSLYSNPEIDMWILRRIHAKRYIKLFYRELILSWQRMIRTKDLLNVFKNKFDRYQLEVAINMYMHKHNKITVRYPFSADNSFKSDKWWFWYWWKRDFLMYKDILWYQWLINFLKHVFLFNPKSNKKYLKNKSESYVLKK